MIRLLPLLPDFAVTVDDRLPLLPAALEAECAAIWGAARARLGERLFNGPIFGLAACRPERLSLRRLDYRLLLAARDRPAVAAALGARALGVSGVLLSPDGVVLGRRAHTLAVEPGCWEAAPAGSLDRPDPLALLADELQEELGLGAADITATRPLGLAHDQAADRYELLVKVTTDLDAAALGRRHRSGGSGEYDTIAVVAPAALAAFLARTAGAQVRGLAALLGFAGVLPGP